ncbi:hypothetical protein [uncultured Methylobacterium sp.]|jgi:hypothetical protein|uniref:hypothetical protein n=1 Tax=uncultured Methylobacterium sp. TaxID=157278 RepID=UPI002619D0C9|nr:hypothetical protein [uncultured Methylobacterium sp.]
MFAAVVLVLVLTTPGRPPETMARPMPDLAICAADATAWLAGQENAGGDASAVIFRRPTAGARHASCLTIPAEGKDA